MPFLQPQGRGSFTLPRRARLKQLQPPLILTPSAPDDLLSNTSTAYVFLAHGAAAKFMMLLRLRDACVMFVAMLT
jgi:hypothetical protein